jgi:rRNA maturation endonuclease Nob1
MSDPPIVTVMKKQLNYVCRIDKYCNRRGWIARCGSCMRGVLLRNRRNTRCRVCGARVIEIWRSKR